MQKKKKTQAAESKGYLLDIEEKTRIVLASKDEEAILKFVKEEVLKSYRNGVEKGKRAPK